MFQALHTNARGPFSMGYDGDLGTVDFFLNGANRQPGCSEWAPVDPCSHSYAIYLLTELNQRNLADSGSSYRYSTIGM